MSTKLTPKRDLHQYSEATLTAVCTLTGFATQGLLHEITAASISLAAFNNVFIPFRSPRLVLIDSANTHKPVLIQFLENLGMPYYMATPEVHNSILCKRLHRFLNNI